MKRDAFIDTSGAYRYFLSRLWDESLPAVCFIMLNPSKADAEVDDPTIRRCIGFARRWEYGSLYVVNLFALRATDPRELLSVADPFGPDRLPWVGRAVQQSALTIVAWGSRGGLMNADEGMSHYLRDAGVQPSCLGVTRDGSPRHPLYLRADQETEAWRPEG